MKNSMKLLSQIELENTREKHKPLRMKCIEPVLSSFLDLFTENQFSRGGKGKWIFQPKYQGCCRFPISVFRFPISGHFRNRNSDFRLPTSVFFWSIGIPISVFRFFGSKIGTEFCSHNAKNFSRAPSARKFIHCIIYKLLFFLVSRMRSSLKS